VLEPFDLTLDSFADSRRVGSWLVHRGDGGLKDIEWATQIVRNTTDESELLLPLLREGDGHVVEGDGDLPNVTRSILCRVHICIAFGKSLNRFNDGQQWLQGATPQPNEYSSDSREKNDNRRGTCDVGCTIPPGSVGHRPARIQVFARNNAPQVPNQVVKM
jgi:hypothetical protein